MRARRTVGLFVLSASLLACGREGSAKLDGRWKGVRVEGVPADRQGRATAFAMATQLLAHDNRISIAVPGAADESTYVVEKETDTQVIVRSAVDGGARETFDVSPDGATLTWRIDQRSIVFAKLAD